MAKTIFEQTGGTYTMQGDYRLPNLTLPAEEERPIGCGDSAVSDICNSTIKVSAATCSLPANSVPTLLI